MFKKTKFSVLFGAICLAGLSAKAITPEYNTYLRIGSGSNGKGGVQQCIANKGSSGNEFRLGNECGTYGEFMIGAPLIKGEGEGSPYWKVFSDFAFSYGNRKSWENNNANNWVLTELYTEAGNVDGLRFSVWAGKRYFRWSDVHMMDFYPVNFSGPGFGLGDIAFAGGVFHAALMQNAGSDEMSSTTAAPGASEDVDTEIGKAAKTSLHLRLEQLKTDMGAFSIWLSGATTASTKNSAGTRNYKGTTGSFVALKHNLSGEGYSNELGVAYGNSNMSNMWTGGELVLDCADDSNKECTVAKSNRVRAWNNFMLERGNLSTQLALIHDEYDNGTNANSKVRWSTVGIRPVYSFTDHLSLAFETGVSHVVDESDNLGSRTLQRLTIAPQLSMARGYYSRPVLRAYYSKTLWNDRNKISAKDTAFANDTSADAFGVQTEVWF